MAEEMHDETLIDRFSELPDSLVLHILSFLDTTKESVRTSLLSKRWHNIWTWIDSFSFTDFEIDGSAHHFVSAVNKTLIQCAKNPEIKKFKIDFNQRELTDHSDFNSWIAFAVSRNVEDLQFDLYYESFDFVLPQFVFTNSVFTKLRLGFCVWNPNGPIEWKMVRVLYIAYSCLSEDLIKNILSGSPVLEILELEECYGFSRLDITSRSVKTLVVNGYFRLRDAGDDDNDDDYGRVVEVTAPNILSLDIKGSFYIWQVMLVDVSSLVKANLDYIQVLHHWTPALEETREEIMKRFIRKLHHVKKLTVGVNCSTVISCLKAKGFTFPSNMEYSYIGLLDAEIDDEANGNKDEHGSDDKKVDHVPGVDAVDHGPNRVSEVDHDPRIDKVDN